MITCDVDLFAHDGDGDPERTEESARYLQRTIEKRKLVIKSTTILVRPSEKTKPNFRRAVALCQIWNPLTVENYEVC